MRQELGKLKSNKYYIFKGVAGQNAYQHRIIYDVVLVDDQGNEKYVSKHCLVAQKPFKSIKGKSPVSFTGKIYHYIRRNGTHDYSIKVNRVVTA